MSKSVHSLLFHPQAFSRKIVSLLLVWALVMTSMPAYSAPAGSVPHWSTGWNAELGPLSGMLKKSAAAAVQPPEIQPVKPRATSSPAVIKRSSTVSIQPGALRPVVFPGLPSSDLSLLLGSPLHNLPGSNLMFQSGGPASLAVYVGYADNLRADPNFPVPWQGSPNTTFIG